jgi:hypothetical protein
MVFVFSVEMVNPFSFAHLDTVFVAFCIRASDVFGVLLLVRINQSAAYPSILVDSSAYFSHCHQQEGHAQYDYVFDFSRC